jgi:thioredoxin-related protein
MAAPMKLVFALLLTLTVQALAAQTIETTTDLPTIARLSAAQGRVLILYVSRPSCPYCAQLEKDVLLPLLKDHDLMAQVTLRELSWTSAVITGFDKQQHSAAEVITAWDIVGTPTLLFLDGSGHEIAERMAGYPSADFYWYYLEEAIKKAQTTLVNQQSAR